MTIISTVTSTEAPAAIGAYSQAVRTGELVFVSGQLPLDPATGELVGADVRAQAAQSLSNGAAILAAAGSSMDRVVKTTILLTDIADFAAVNEVYGERFTGPVLPARAAYQVAALPRGANVEIEFVAVCGD